MTEDLQARLDTITCHLEGLAATVGALRLNMANLHRELAWRRIAPAPGPEDDPAELALEVSQLRQQLAAFRFESHQEHQELYRNGHDRAMDALIAGPPCPDCTWPGAAELPDGVLQRERSFTVPLCKPRSIESTGSTASTGAAIDPTAAGAMVARRAGAGCP